MEENIVAEENKPAEVVKKRKGRPPKNPITQPSVNVSAPPTGSEPLPPDLPPPPVQRQPQKSTSCLYKSTVKREIRVTVNRPQYGGNIEEKRLRYVEEQCANAADGINGYCRHHSYPVKAPLSKTIKRNDTKWIEIDGHPQEIKSEEVVTLLYNIGEHIDASQFTPKEIEDLYSTGLIGKRLGQEYVMEHKGKRKLDNASINVILSTNTPQEVASILKVNNYDNDTLDRFATGTNNELIKEAIRELKK